MGAICTTNLYEYIIEKQKWRDKNDTRIRSRAGNG